MIYFDSAATTLQKPAAVPRAAARAMTTMTTPGRGDYPASRAAAELMLALRTEAADFFGAAQPENVILTGSATHGLNIAIRDLVHPGDTVVISGYEHNAVTRPLHAVGGVSVKIVNAPLFAPEQMAEGFRRALAEGGAAAVICTHVSNAFGYVLPVQEIAALCRERQVPLIVDAAQSAGTLPVDVEGWGAAYVAMPGHKGLYGPQGTGLLLCGKDRTPSPLLAGGTGSLSRQQDMPDFLPDRLEAGTQNVHGAAGLLEGLRFVARQGTGPILRHERRVIRRLAERLGDRSGVRAFYGGDQSGGVLSVILDGEAPEVTADRLAERGIAVRAGLHCAPLAHITAGTVRTGTVRFSASAFNTLQEADQAADALLET
mgnify:CR=1 FL=1